MTTLTPSQSRSLRALIDTFIPPLEEDEVEKALQPDPRHGISNKPVLSAKKRAAAKKVLRLSGSELGVAAAVEELLGSGVLSWEESTSLVGVLDLLGSALGSAILCSTLPFKGAFTDRSRAEREALLMGLSGSPIPVQRKAFNDIKRLVFSLALSLVKEPVQEPGKPPLTGRDAEATNPLWEAIGYEPIERGAGEALKPWAELDFKEHMVATDGAKPLDLEVDVVIVGSGAGGGVSAAQLAASGLKVLVLEKGPFVPPSEVTTLEKDAFQQCYEKSGLLTTSDGSMAVLAGTTFGGGTTVNWACCIPTPDGVRREWARVHGLTQFEPSTITTADSGHDVRPRGSQGSIAPAVTDFEKSLAAVWARIGASTDDVVPNGNNQVLLGGCAALGWPARITAQNLKRPNDDSAGWTSLCDREGNKQGTMVTFLADAARTGNCKFLDRCTVEVVTIARPPKRGERPQATGVVGAVQVPGVDAPVPIRVTARRAVVASGGAIHTPALLLRSGLGSLNSHVGRHLRLHPVTAAIAQFQDRHIDIYKKAPMTTVSDVDASGPCFDGYGAKLEVPSVHPGLMAACSPWRGGFAAKSLLLESRSAAALIVLQRDCDSEGQVVLSNSPWWRYGWMPRASALNTPIIHFKIGSLDARSMLHSLGSCVRVLEAAGATYVSTLHAGPYGLERYFPPATRAKAVRAEEVDNFCGAINDAGLPMHGVGLFSAHQMGTCRMGSDPLSSVVDEDGESWDVDGLFVADASVFPTASGANPMPTTLALSHLISSRLAARLAEGGQGRPEGPVARQRRQRREKAAAAQAVAARASAIKWLAGGLAVGLAAFAVARARR